MRCNAWIATARDLVDARKGKPRQTNLGRAVSTTYYAMFHCLAKCCADSLVGGRSSHRSGPAWHQVYRALQHKRTAEQCKKQQVVSKFPEGIVEFANQFTKMQRKRHRADYDPTSRWEKRTVVQDIDETEEIIGRFYQSPLKDRRAFAAYVLLPSRKD